MIKTELVNEESSSETETLSKSRLYTGVTVVIIIAIVAIVGYLVVHQTDSKTTIGPSSIVGNNTKPLPLSSSSNNNINPSSSTQSNTTQSSTNSSNLGSQSYNLQDNVPTGKANQPTGSSIQSASGYQNSVNP